MNDNMINQDQNGNGGEQKNALTKDQLAGMFDDANQSQMPQAAPMEQAQPQYEVVATDIPPTRRPLTNTPLDSLLGSDPRQTPYDPSSPFAQRSDKLLGTDVEWFLNPMVRPEIMERFEDAEEFEASRSAAFNELFYRKQDEWMQEGINTPTELFRAANKVYEPKEGEEDSPELRRKRELLGEEAYNERTARAEERGLLATMGYAFLNPFSKLTSASDDYVAGVYSDVLDGRGMTEKSKKLMDKAVRESLIAGEEIKQKELGEDPLWFAATGLAQGFGSILATAAASVAGGFTGAGAGIIGGFATGGLPGAVAGGVTGFGYGMTAGGVAGGFLMSVDEVTADVYLRTGDMSKAMQIGMAAAVPMGLLEAWGFGAIAKAPIKKLGQEAFFDQAMKEVIQEGMKLGTAQANKKAFSEAAQRLGTEWFMRSPHRKFVIRDAAEGFIAEGFTEGSQSISADLVEQVESIRTGRTDIGMHSMNDLAEAGKGYFWDALFGGFIGSTIKGGRQLMSRPTDLAAGYQIVDAVNEGKIAEMRTSYESRLRKHVDGKLLTEQEGKEALEFFDRTADVAARDMNGITDRHAQGQLFYLKSLETEINSQAAILNGRLGPEAQSQLVTALDKTNKAIQAKRLAIREGNAPVVFEKTFRKDAGITDLIAKTGVRVDDSLDGNLLTLQRMGMKPFKQKMQQIQRVLQKRDLNENEIATAAEIEKITGVQIARTKEEASIISDVSFLSNRGLNMENAFAIAENLSHIKTLYDEAKDKKQPLKFYDEISGKEVVVNPLLAQALFAENGGFNNENQTHKSLDYYVEKTTAFLENAQKDAQKIEESSYELITETQALEEADALKAAEEQKAEEQAQQAAQAVVEEGKTKEEQSKIVTQAKDIAKTGVDEPKGASSATDTDTETKAEVRAKDAFADMANPTDNDKAADEAGFDDRFHAVSSYLKQTGGDPNSLKTDGRVDNAKVNEIFEGLNSTSIKAIGEESNTASETRSKRKEAAEQAKIEEKAKIAEQEDAAAEQATKTDEKPVEKKETVSEKRAKELSKTDTDALVNKVLDQSSPQVKTMALGKLAKSLGLKLADIKKEKGFTGALTAEQADAIARELHQGSLKNQPQSKPKGGKKKSASTSDVNSTGTVSDPKSVKDANKRVDKKDKGITDKTPRKVIPPSAEVDAMEKAINDYELKLIAAQVPAPLRKQMLEDFKKGIGSANYRLSPGENNVVTLEDLRRRDNYVSYFSDVFGIGAEMDTKFLLDAFGDRAVGAAVQSGVKYAANATPETIPHEYSHIYVRAMRMAGKRGPMFKVIGKLLENTELAKIVRQKYPLLEGDLLTEEIIATAAGKGVEQITNVLEDGKNADKVRKARQVFWNTVKSMFQGKEQLGKALSAAMLLLDGKNAPITDALKESFRNDPAAMKDIDLAALMEQMNAFTGRKAVLNVLNRTLIQRGGLLNDTDGDQWTENTKLFYSAPEAFIIDAILRAANKKGGEDMQMYLMGRTEQDVRDFMNRVKSIQKDDTTDLSQKVADLDAMATEYLDELNKNHPKEHDFLIRAMVNSRNIPNALPDMVIEGYQDIQVAPTLKRVITGLISETGRMVEPYKVYNVVYTAAVRSANIEEFLDNLNDMAVNHEEGWIAQLFKERLVSIYHRGEGETGEVRTQSFDQQQKTGRIDVLQPLLQEFKSMVLLEHRTYEVNGDGFMSYTANPDPRTVDQAKRRIRGIIQKLEESPQYASDAQRHIRTVMANFLPSDTNKRLKGLKGSERRSVDLDIATEMYANFLRNFNYNYSEKNIKKALDVVYKDQKNVNDAVRELIGSGETINFADAENRDSYFGKHEAMINQLAKQSAKSTMLGSKYYDGNGKLQMTLGFQSHLDRTVNRMFNTDGSGTNVIGRMLQTNFYKNNDVVKQWRKNGSTGVALLREMRKTSDEGRKRSVSYDNMDTSAEMAFHMQDWLDGEESYMETFGLNGERKSRYQFAVKNYGLQEGLEKLNALGVQIERRLNEKLANGKIKMTDAAKEAVSKSFPVQIEEVNGKYKFRGLSTAENTTKTGDLIKRDVDLMMELYESGSWPNSLKEKVKTTAMQKQGLKDGATDTEINDAVKMLFAERAVNYMVNQTELADVFMGDMANFDKVNKIIKRSMGFGSRGYDFGKPPKPIKLLILKDDVRTFDDPNEIDPKTKKPKRTEVESTDSMVYYGERFNNWLKGQGKGLRDFGDNHKLHIFDVLHEGENAGDMNWIKHAGIGLQNSTDEQGNKTTNFDSLDPEGGTRFKSVAKMLNDSEAQLADGEFVIAVHESAVKNLQEKFKSQGIDIGSNVNMANAVTIEPSTVVANFNMNQKANEQLRTKHMSVQLQRIVAENATAEQRDAYYDSMIEALNLQQQIVDLKEGTGQDLVKNIIDRSFLNDLFISSESHLNFLSKLSKDPDSYKHIEDPNLFQTALGHLTKLGNSAFMPMMKGGVMQTVPDLSNSLKYKETGTPEVIVPPSMGRPGEEILITRIPSSGPEATFVGYVKSNGPANMNVIVTPADFYVMSNADNDGDQLHVFRKPKAKDNMAETLKDVDLDQRIAELQEQGGADEEINAIKIQQLERQKNLALQKMWNSMAEVMKSPEYMKLRNKPLDVAPVQEILNKLERPTGIDVIGTMAGTMSNNRSVALGKSTIGVFANAKKTVSFLAENDVQLLDWEGKAKPIKINVGGKSYDLGAFTNKNSQALSVILQTGLDQISNFQLEAMGIHKYNMQEFIAMASLADVNTGEPVSLENVLRFFDPNNEINAAYRQGLYDMGGVFGENQFINARERKAVLNEILEGLDENAQGYDIAKQHITALKNLADQGEGMRVIVDILSLDKGVPYGLEEVVSAHESLMEIEKQFAESLRRESGGVGNSNMMLSMRTYFPLIDTPLFQHYAEKLRDQLGKYESTTLRYHPDVHRLYRESAKTLFGKERMYSSDVSFSTNVIERMLDRSVQSKKYTTGGVDASERAFLSKAGAYLFETLAPKKYQDRFVGAPYDYSAEDKDRMRSALEAHYEGKIILDPADVTEYEEVTKESIHRSIMQGALQDNYFVQNLKVYKNVDPDTKDIVYNLRMDGKKVDYSNKQQIAELKQAFRQLPKSMRDLVIDYVAISATTHNLNKSALWAILDDERQGNRYRVAGHMIGTEMALEGSRNKKRLQETITLASRKEGMQKQIPTNNKKFKVFKRLDDSELDIARSQIGATLERLFPMSHTDLNKNVKKSDLMKVTIPSSQLTSDMMPPYVYYDSATKKEYALVDVDTPTSNQSRNALYVDITDVWNSIENRVHPFVIEQRDKDGNIVSSEPQSADIDETLDAVKKDLDQVGLAGMAATNAVLGNKLSVSRGVALISSDEKRYNRIVETLKDTWGDMIVVEDWATYEGKTDGAIGQADVRDKKGILQRVVGWALEGGSLDVPPHEYAHHYVKMLANMDFVKEGIKKYGSEEAYVQAIGEDYVKMIGRNNIEKHLRVLSYKFRNAIDAKAKDGIGFWAAAQMVFGSPDVAEIAAYGLLVGKHKGEAAPLSQGGLVGNMRGMNSNNKSNYANTVADSGKMEGQPSTARNVVTTADAESKVSAIIQETAAQVSPMSLSANGTVNVGGIKSDSLSKLVTAFFNHLEDEFNSVDKNVIDPVQKKSKWSSASMTEGQFKAIRHMFTEKMKVDNSMSAVDNAQMIYDRRINQNQPLVNVANMQALLVFRLANPTTPYPASMGLLTNFSQEERNYVDNTVKGLIHAKRIAMAQQANENTIITDGDNVVSAKNVAQSLQNQMQSNMANIKATIQNWFTGNVVGNATIVQSLTIQSKLMGITGDKNNALYEAMHGSFVKGLTRKAVLLTGTSKNPGFNEVMAGVKSAFKKKAFYGDDRLTVDKLGEKLTLNGRSRQMDFSIMEVLSMYMMSTYVDPLTGESYRERMLTNGITVDRARSKTSPYNEQFFITDQTLADVDAFVRGYEGNALINAIGEMKRARDMAMEHANTTYNQLYGENHPYYGTDWIPTYSTGVSTTDNVSAVQSLGTFDQEINPYFQHSPTSALQIRDAFNMFNRIGHDAAGYNAFAVAQKNYTSLMESTFQVGNRTTTLKEFLSRSEIQETWKDIEQHHFRNINQTFRTGEYAVTDESGKKTVDSSKKVTDWIDKQLKRFFTIYGLGLNVGSALVQSVSSMLVIKHVGPLTYARSLAKLSTIKGTIDAYRQMMEHSPYLRERMLSGQIDPLLVKDGGSDVYNKLQDFTMIGIRKMDALAVTHIWEMAAHDTKLKHNYVEGSPEYWNHVARYAEEMVMETQPTSDEFHKNSYQQDKVGKYAYMFGSQRTKLMDYAFEAWAGFRIRPSWEELAKGLAQLGILAMQMMAVAYIKRRVSNARKELKGEHAIDPRHKFDEDKMDEIRNTNLYWDTLSGFASLIPFAGIFTGSFFEYQRRKHSLDETESVRKQKAAMYTPDAFTIPANEFIENIKAPFGKSYNIYDEKSVDELIKDVAKAAVFLPREASNFVDIWYSLKYIPLAATEDEITAQYGYGFRPTTGTIKGESEIANPDMLGTLSKRIGIPELKKTMGEWKDKFMPAND